MSKAVPEPSELRIELGAPDELFDGRNSQILQGIPGEDPGIDHILNELSGRSRRDSFTILILLPREEATAEVEQGMRHAIARYCDMGIGRIENELKAIYREGRQALLFGAILLAGFLALSELVLQSGAAKGIRDFFGNGLFLVAAWVGMWYPLDTLIYAGRPYRIERRLLQSLRQTEILVRSRDDE